MKLPDPQGAKLLITRLREIAKRESLPEQWVTASVAIVAHESGFDPKAQLATDPGPLGSISWWQLNSKAHNVGWELASDPVRSTDAWFSWQNPRKHWESCGGVAGFDRDPVAFMRCYAPKTQVSDPWDAKMATAALMNALDAMQQTETLGPSTNPINGWIEENIPGASEAKDLGENIKKVSEAIVSPATWGRAGLGFLGLVLITVGVVALAFRFGGKEAVQVVNSS